MLIHGFTLTVNRFDPDDVDKFGNRGEPATHTISDCIAAPAGSNEHTDDEVLTVENDSILAPFDADVVPTDELVIPDGQPLEAGTYQVDGKPQRWPSPFDGDNAAGGTVIPVTRATS